MTSRQHAMEGQLGLALDQPNRRRGYRIDPAFQTRFRTTLVSFAMLIIVAVALLSLAVRWVVANPAALPTSPLVPGAAFALGLAIVAVSFRLADRISHRYCGPVYRIASTLAAVQRGERPAPIQLRKNDEFQDLAESINETLRSLGAMPPKAEAELAPPDPGRRSS